jgi:ectoine hydroxylase-related dioxygenase (phytanoyl-CoA dioxygenase family)
MSSIEERLRAIEEYNLRGYTIYHDVLSPEICDQITNSILDESFRILFRDVPEDRKPDYHNPEHFELLVDKATRDRCGIPDTAIWENGNPRTPIWSKNNGMINIYFNRLLHQHIHFNPDVFLRIAALYGHNNIGYTKGMDRVGFKIRGSVDMPTHLDYHLFNPHLNPDPVRVQSFFNCSVDSTIDPRDSGTIQLIPYFQLYWQIASRYFQRIPLSTEEYRQSLPQPLGKQFTKELPAFNLFLRDLHNWRDGRPIEYAHKDDLTYYADLIPTLPCEYHELKWTPIPLRTGDLICWDQRLPHSNLRNKSMIPRVVAYVSLFPFPNHYHGSSYQREVIERLQRGDNDGQGSNRLNQYEKIILRGPDFEYIYTPRMPSPHYSTLEEFQAYCHRLQGL